MEDFDSREDVCFYRTKAQLARNRGAYAEAAAWERKLIELYEAQK